MKTYKISFINETSPVKSECEDAFVINEQAEVYGVLDGATPLEEFRDENGHNGAYLASRIFQHHFEKMERSHSLLEKLEEANQKLKNQMLAYEIDVHSGYKRWTTCVAFIKLEDSYVDFVHLGDCMIMARYCHGEVRILTKDTVTGISQRAKVKRERDREAGLDLPKETFYEDRLESLRYNRSLANVEGGYTVADGSSNALDMVQQGRVSREGIQDILLLSDGLFHRKWSLTDVYQRIEEVGLEAYVEELTEDLRSHGHHIDDRTAVWVQFE
ncbi:serine/threonine protein phosphatase [Halobacillus fulvus]|nr:serine/threonine protein phosphatase [Halobacillus fulvus]